MIIELINYWMFYKKFIGTKNEYENINKLMRNVYQVKIDAWKKLIDQQL